MGNRKSEEQHPVSIGTEEVTVMRNSLCRPSVIAVLLLLAACPPWATAANRIFIADQTVDIGATNVVIPVRIDNEGVERNGISIALKWDETKLTITAVERAGASAIAPNVPPGFIGQVFAANGKLHWAVVTDMSGPDLLDTIPIGANQVLLNLKANVIAAAPTTATITPQDFPAETPTGGWTNVFVHGTDPSLKAPELVLAAGIITIGSTVKFQRGDLNNDGTQDLSDAIMLLGFLYTGQPATLICEAAGRLNEGNDVDLSDAIYLLGFLYLGTAAPPYAGYPGCEEFPACPKGKLCP